MLDAPHRVGQAVIITVAAPRVKIGSLCLAASARLERALDVLDHACRLVIGHDLTVEYRVDHQDGVLGRAGVNPDRSVHPDRDLERDALAEAAQHRTVCPQ